MYAEAEESCSHALELLSDSATDQNKWQPKLIIRRILASKALGKSKAAVSD